MKSLFQTALDSLPETMRSTFIKVYQMESQKEFKKNYQVVLKELIFFSIYTSKQPVLIQISGSCQDGLFFMYKEGSCAEDLILVQTDPCGYGEYNIIYLGKNLFLKSNWKMRLFHTIYYDTLDYGDNEYEYFEMIVMTKYLEWHSKFTLKRWNNDHLVDEDDE